MSDTSGCHKGLSLVRRQLDRRLENRAFIHKPLLRACSARVFYCYHARSGVWRREDSGQNSKKCQRPETEPLYRLSLSPLAFEPSSRKNPVVLHVVVGDAPDLPRFL